ncbi:SICAvar, type I [Plasmodium knowlesi strain H]|uniref:SICAvar, type I n=3 Tax=Plasmodium knowlesi TaxID=5850 RepID=A0A5E7WZM8_PLAKH|nr:SICAvar, type I [Plasmodium knowlesi strain H]OTN65790.1 SICAvar type II [Plasmodium knowlesi]CAA9987899.1 SICAvar, type I [Plasmodium knowlesi strain H]SBO22256.1 SICAvar, type I [Plasmodium knowlesi strain H]SBO28832.1 SICAvar, type I [Plasmodium knowlesi strain H]VVS77373.1 SICAvar, type I [Plasmodium knowlesi strain H]
MAASKAAPSTPQKASSKEDERIQRGLTKLETAFKDPLTEYGPLLAKCKGGVDKTSNSAEIQPHKDDLCNYITSAVRGTYGNSRSKGQGTSPSPGPVSGPVWSGLDRKNRCYMLRICMKYLMHHSCISDSDVKKILNAMEPQVKTWRVGEGSEEAKRRNREAFGNCIKKTWDKNYRGEKDLKCRVIEVLEKVNIIQDKKLNPLKSVLSGAGSATCSTSYDNSCNNGTAGVGGSGGGAVVDDVDDVVSDSDEDDDDEDEDVVLGAATTASSTQSPSLPVGKKGKGIVPSLSSFPFDSIHPYLPLVPSILGIITITYFLWKYFGQLGKIKRFRRAPLRIPGPSVQEQVLDHVQQDSSHEYRLFKERKPRYVPTRTKRSGRDPAGSGRVNRRTIIEIHFEVLDECQKGDTQLAQKDFLELLVQEFMGSELMEEEQVPKEEVLMEGVPMEGIPLEQAPMERVPNLGSGFKV